MPFRGRFVSNGHVLFLSKKKQDRRETLKAAGLSGYGEWQAVGFVCVFHFLESVSLSRMRGSKTDVCISSPVMSILREDIGQFPDPPFENQHGRL